MTPQDTLLELLARIGAGHGDPVSIGDRELSAWPVAATAAMKAQKLLVKARPSAAVTCPGCERQCLMPVHVVSVGDTSTGFVSCDKRSDISRVIVALADLEQWQSSAKLVADLLAALLDVRRPTDRESSGHWEIGLLKGKKTSAHVRLLSDGELKLTLAGHRLALGELLELKGDRFVVDRQRLDRCVAHPVVGCGDIETAEDRRERLKLRMQQEKARGGAYLQRVAAEEHISPSRLKQILTSSAKKKSK